MSLHESSKSLLFISQYSLVLIVCFRCEGLERWLAAREAWCKKPSDGNDEQKNEDQHKHAVPVDVDGIIDVLFDPRWRGGGGKVKISPVPPRFPKNVPLPQMIDVLTDLWEAEGLDV